MTRDHGTWTIHLSGCRCDTCVTACPHGTATGYSSWGCRCEPCRVANRRRGKDYQLRKHRGVPIWGDVELVRNHIKQLRAGGASYLGIATAMGYADKWQIQKIMRQPRVTSVTESRILAVTLEDIPARSFVSSLGTSRRLKALARNGYACQHVAHAIGFDVVTLRKIMRFDQRRTRRWVVDAVTEFYRRHADTPGESDVTRRHAERHRWLPPMAWDDEDFDDPKGQARAHSRIKR